MGMEAPWYKKSGKDFGDLKKNRTEVDFLTNLLSTKYKPKLFPLI